MNELKILKSIYLVRHPETQSSKGTCYGNSDILPSEEQLRATLIEVNNMLQQITPQIVYTSPLTRCQMLARELASENMVIDELLREIDFGRWEMVAWKDIPQDEQKAWGNDFINNKIHGGENFFDVQHRVIQFWNKLMHSKEKIIYVIAHAGIFRALLAHLLKSSPKHIFAVEIDYGSVIQINWSNESYYKIKFL